MTQPWIEGRFEENMITTTVEHPFYVLLRGWVEAIDLRTGDQVRQLDGGYGAVQRVAVETAPQEMYNLTVAEAHTFFVGDGGWLVHNADPCKLPKRGKSHGNSLDNDRPNILYKMRDAQSGRLLKYGVTSNIKRRYTQAQRSGVIISELARGSRRQMIQAERFIVRRYGGPRNREPWSPYGRNGPLR